MTGVRSRLGTALLALAAATVLLGSSASAPAMDHQARYATAAVTTRAATPCSMAGLTAVEGLLTCRSWVTYSPKKFGSISVKRLTADLAFLHAQGFRGLVTYDVAGNLAKAPRIAKRLGFQKVLAGIDDPQAGVVDQAAKVAADADGVVIGNEGVATGRYTYAQLASWVAEVKGDPRTSGLEVTTSEPWILYLDQGQPWQYPQLLSLGDFAFPNFQPYFDPDPQWHSDPVGAARLVHDNWVTWFAGAPHPVVLKESWWPSALGDPGNEASTATVCSASPANQKAYFSALRGYSDIRFVWGEAQDVPKDPEQVTWCTEPQQDPARHWGLWTSLRAGRAKPVVGVVETGRY